MDLLWLVILLFSFSSFLFPWGGGDNSTLTRIFDSSTVMGVVVITMFEATVYICTDY